MKNVGHGAHLRGKDHCTCLPCLSIEKQYHVLGMHACLLAEHSLHIAILSNCLKEALGNKPHKLFHSSELHMSVHGVSLNF